MHNADTDKLTEAIELASEGRDVALFAAHKQHRHQLHEQGHAMAGGKAKRHGSYTLAFDTGGRISFHVIQRRPTDDRRLLDGRPGVVPIYHPAALDYWQQMRRPQPRGHRV